jgi:hypothetical protein
VSKLKAPFPHFGGKLPVAEIVWQLLGEDVQNYIEPFAGSLAVLLARGNFEDKTETVNELDPYIANFWRAINEDPEAVARFADYPVIETDLHARHLWLVNQTGFREKMLEDPHYFDPQIAGWWVWGKSIFIGNKWCKFTNNGMQKPDKIIPRTKNAGVHRKHLMPTNSPIFVSDIYEYFEILCYRLRRVRVISGDFERVLTPSYTTKAAPTTAIFLDPPYDQFGDIYGHGEVWNRCLEWCKKHWHYQNLRIVLCGYEGSGVPEDWEYIAWTAQGGYGLHNNDNRYRERIWYNPACLKLNKSEQLSLFA